MSSSGIVEFSHDPHPLPRRRQASRALSRRSSEIIRQSASGIDEGRAESRSAWAPSDLSPGERGICWEKLIPLQAVLARHCEKRASTSKHGWLCTNACRKTSWQLPCGAALQQRIDDFEKRAIEGCHAVPTPNVPHQVEHHHAAEREHDEACAEPGDDPT